MSSADFREIPSDGVRVRFESDKTYEELVAALPSDIGEKPVVIGDLPAATFQDWESITAEIETQSTPDVAGKQAINGGRGHKQSLKGAEHGRYGI